MKLYLVRHGETAQNAADIHQKDDSPLSETGLEQAKFVAQRFQKIAIDLIFSSPSQRAKQTAEIIDAHLNKKIVFSDTLKERRRPSEIMGMEYKNPKALEVKEEIRKHIGDPSWHYSDEENFFDLKTRAETFFELLNGQSEENILAVTHTVTMKMIVGLIILGQELTPIGFEQLFVSLKIKNTGVTLCEKEADGWKLVTWNDHAHLG